MSAYKISEGIYAVGVQNPNLRVFDIIMKTEFGTTYNAYLVKGAEKTALIETVHAGFFDEYIDNLKQVCDVNSIDYLILNHCEPDHSGSVGALLNLNPKIEVIASVPGVKYLAAIANMPFKSRAAKDGDTLDLGGRTLTFVSAPFLHWPDSMFTYIESEKTLFSCDFLGAHYCEPRYLDRYIMYPRDYQSAFAYYYNCIFGPFQRFVLAGLAKMDALAVSVVCPSHGPVLTDLIDDAKEKYRAWSTPKAKAQKTALVLYVSAYGCTKKLAETADEVLRENGYQTALLNAIETAPETLAEKLNDADVLMLGSPTINRDALKPIWDAVAAIDAVSCKDTPCGVFGSYGWSGEGVPMLAQRLRMLNLKVCGDGFRANFVPNEAELNAMREYTREIIKDCTI
ncbi:MAG: FprA family A-type flavoprotein [Clostridiales bacterium]|jgi:flavorubredoxin|nr:FprA family A-type flavoprotein [Clostridiales bacterium]